MKLLIAKLKDQTGDSIVEALLAVLIAALGTALLATMVMTSTNVVAQNRAVMTAAYTAENTLAGNGGTVVPDTTLKVEGIEGVSSLEVTTNKEGVFTRYRSTEESKTVGEST